MTTIGFIMILKGKLSCLTIFIVVLYYWFSEESSHDQNSQWSYNSYDNILTVEEDKRSSHIKGIEK